jgi:hypothetical protein
MTNKHWKRAAIAVACVVLAMSAIFVGYVVLLGFIAHGD